MAEPLAALPLPAVAIGRHVRPLSVGDLLDLALRLYRGNFGLYFVLTLIFEVPVFLLGKVYEGVLGTVKPDQLGTLEPQALLEAGLLLASAIPITILLMSLLMAWAQGAVLIAGEAAWHGRTPSVRGSLALLRGRFGRLTGTHLLSQLLLGLAVLGAMLPGSALAVLAGLQHSIPALVGSLLMVLVAAVIVFLFFYLRWFLVLPAAVLEGLPPRAALARSAALMRGRVSPAFLGGVKSRASIVLLVLFFITLVPAALIGLPQYLLMAAYSPQPGVMDPSTVPMIFRLPLEAVQLGLSTLVAPFSFLATLAFWYDLRVRREGYDLELRAEALGSGG